MLYQKKMLHWESLFTDNKVKNTGVSADFFLVSYRKHRTQMQPFCTVPIDSWLAKKTCEYSN